MARCSRCNIMWSLSVTCNRLVVFTDSSTSKTDRQDKTEIVLKVSLSTIKPTKQHVCINLLHRVIVPCIDSLMKLGQCLELFNFSQIWLRSELSLASLNWYVAACEFLGNTIAGHMRVTLCTTQYNLRLRVYENIILNCYAFYEKSEWPKKVITIFIISLNIHDSHATRNEVTSNLACRDMSVMRFYSYHIEFSSENITIKRN